MPSLPPLQLYLTVRLARWMSSSAAFQELIKHVGLPATNLMEGMENNFCHGDQAHVKLKTSNYGGTETTAVQEFKYVVKPDLTMEYPGERRATDLDVFLLAAGATRRDDSERLNVLFAEIAGRFSDDMLDSVQAVILRKAKEAFMTARPLQREANKSKTDLWNNPSLVQVACWQDDEMTQIPLKLRAGQIAKFGSHEEMVDLEVVLCEPEQADSDLLNAAQLRGKVMVTKRGGCSFIETAQRAVAAGARGLVIVNSDDTIFPAGGEGDYCAGIPVVMIKANDADALLAFGNSSFVYSLKKQDTDKTQVVVNSFSVSSGNLRGSGKDTRGTFTINGTESNRHVQFEKRYDSATLTPAVTAIFRSLDTNGNGALCLEEFTPWIQGELQGLSKENAEKMISIFDKSHNYVTSEADV